MADTDAKFTTGSLMGHVTAMSFTASIGLMAIFAVDLVDMVFISMLGNVALAAAIGYAGSILFFTNSINIGLSIAAGALVSRAIGRGDTRAAREFATSVAVYAALTGLLFPVVLFIYLQPILGLIGAEGEAAALATTYLTILLPTMSLMGLAMGAMAVLRAYGDAKRSMYSTLFGGITNAVLDPIFIFALGMGLSGAAIASVIARLVTLYFAMAPAIRHHAAYARPRPGFVLSHGRDVTSLAAPAVLANVATPVGSAFVTREMAKYGTDAVAGMAIIGRLIPVSFSVVFALSGAIGPILGQNFGAGRHDRVRTGYLAGLKFALVYVVVVAVILFALRNLLVDFFDASGLTASLLLLFCGPLALAYIFNGGIFVSNAAFNNLGHPAYSAGINWANCTLGTFPFVLAGSALFGAYGVLIGQAIGTTIFCIVAVWLALRVIENPPDAPKTRAFQPHRRLHTLYTQRGH
ncbi:MATE family efflux transporter [Flavimaricola marinus]|uniref:Multidrug export protein MepA n=1 Tax=Flavimaricola marinus TaxID=1819565 RepID=A0A238LI98_9RHOB|nr:MATE family efflux transporter [Flavimaricola marinus]SMY09409.1 Multidrug export protein MepA [Flavimaricola marinus]